MIPKRIACVYISPSLLQPLQHECWERIRALHPTWEVTLWRDAEAEAFVKDHCLDFWELYDWYPKNVQRADLFRMLLIHRLGGFYLDLDIHLHRSLDPLCAEHAVFPYEWEMSPATFLSRHKRAPTDRSELWQLGNYAFGAEAGHPFIAEILEEMIRRSSLIEPCRLEDNDVLYTTGPDLVSGVFHSQKDVFGPCVTRLMGQNKPPPPKPPIEGDPRWQQFGVYGNHLLSGAWKGGR